MPDIPRDHALDTLPALLKEGYAFIPNRRRRLGSDVFEARLMLENTIFLSGEEATELFYDRARFTREGAAPARLKKTLFGEGGVQGLDGEAHRERKATLMSLMTPDAIERLVDQTLALWRDRLPQWEGMDEVVLKREAEELLTRAVCVWAGVPLQPTDLRPVTHDLVALFETPAAIGPRYWAGKRARHRSDRWAAGLIERAREGSLRPAEGSALAVLAHHRGADGEPLPVHAAAVDLLNVLRPTVAISRYIVFAALALHRYPDWRDRVRDDDGAVEPFVQEVRRLYPFFPFVAARVRRDFEWKGYRFPQGRLVVLDLHGTDHDPRLWEDPEAFRPERFERWDGSAYDFVPQGGGDHYTNHRCAGEWLTIALMKAVVRVLTREVTYEVPDQDLEVRDSRMPAIPESGFVMCNVRRAR